MDIPIDHTHDLTYWWKPVMNGLRKVVNFAFFWLRPRNPQITAIFNSEIKKPRAGRPSPELLRAARERRRKAASVS